MAKGQKMTYEQQIVRLQEIVARLEGEGITLDESVKLYEEGVALASECRKALEEGRSRIARLTQNEGSELREEDVQL